MHTAYACGGERGVERALEPEAREREGREAERLRHARAARGLQRRDELRAAFDAEHGREQQHAALGAEPRERIRQRRARIARVEARRHARRARLREQARRQGGMHDAHRQLRETERVDLVRERARECTRIPCLERRRIDHGDVARLEQIGARRRSEGEVRDPQRAGHGRQEAIRAEASLEHEPDRRQPGREARHTGFDLALGQRRLLPRPEQLRIGMARRAAPV